MLSLSLLLPPISSLSAAPSSKEDNMRMGNPSKVGKISSNYLIEHDAFAVGYDSSKLSPIWVQWHLCKEDFPRSIRRKDKKWEPDPNCPSSQAHSADYKYTGFDRGHLCPSGDRTAKDTLNEQTFYMTNIIPQNHELNVGVWEKFEEFARNQVKNNGLEAYIVAGVLGAGGSNHGYNPSHEPWDKGVFYYLSDFDKYREDHQEDQKEDHQEEKRVRIPKYLWKCVLFVPKGTDWSNIEEGNADMIAIKIENRPPMHPVWKDYLVTVDEIEKATKLDLFSKLPDYVENILEGIKWNGSTLCGKWI